MTKTNNIERRVLAQEVKTDLEHRVVSGYAAVYGRQSEDLGGFIEVIEPGAFDEALSVSDVRALVNHDSNLLLARSSAGTLKLSTDTVGLMYSFEVPATTYGNDLMESLRRGDISQSSFGFSLASGGDEWIEEKGSTPLRKILKVERLYDVSPVTYPAYPDTTVALRHLENIPANSEAEAGKDTNENTQAIQQGLHVTQEQERLNHALHISEQKIRMQ